MQLNCTYVFIYTKSRFSHDTARVNSQNRQSKIVYLYILLERSNHSIPQYIHHISVPSLDSYTDIVLSDCYTGRSTIPGGYNRMVCNPYPTLDPSSSPVDGRKITHILDSSHFWFSAFFVSGVACYIWVRNIKYDTYGYLVTLLIVDRTNHKLHLKHEEKHYTD